MKAYERIGEFNMSTHQHRVYDVDENGAAIGNSSPWKNLPIVGDTSLSPLELWRAAVEIVPGYSIPEITGDVVQIRRKL